MELGYLCNVNRWTGPTGDVTRQHNGAFRREKSLHGPERGAIVLRETFQIFLPLQLSKVYFKIAIGKYVSSNLKY